MPKVITDQEWQVYIACRRGGMNKATAARTAGISRTVADRFERGLPTGRQMANAIKSRWTPQPIGYTDLSKEAKRAWDDFAYFRRRYFGRLSTPWQEEAAYRVLSMIDSPHKELAVVNCPPGSGKPVAVDALVSMADGSRKRLGDIRVGDWVVTHTGTPTPVVAVHEQGVLPVLSVRDGWGRRTTAAYDHPFLTDNGWVGAAALAGHTAPHVLRQAVVTGDYPPLEHFAMAGYFVGDGSCSAGDAAITNADPDVLADVRLCAEALGWTKTTVAPRNGSASVVRFGGGARDWLKQAELWGCTSLTKQVPPWVFTAPDDHVARFLAAYFDCDGYVDAAGRTVSFCSVNRSLLVDVAHLLTRLGIRSSLRRKVATYRDAPYVSWNLWVHDRGVSARTVGAVGAKRHRLALCSDPDPRYASRTQDKSIAVEPAGYATCRCITVEHPDHSFVADDFPVANSTLFTHDIPAWLTVRNRAIRGLFISATQDLADSYSLRLRQTFENDIKVQAPVDDLELGLAVDAEATLIEDFGAFRPSTGVWAVSRFTVAQMEGRMATGEKEFTWQSYGLDTDFIGTRINFAVGDDTVSDKSMLTLEKIEKDRKRWDSVVERRLEPRGALFLVGQRLGPEDLYAYCKSKKAGRSSTRSVHSALAVQVPLLGTLGEMPMRCCDADDGARYHLIRYRAHDELRCRGQHGEDAPYQPHGCLLDPRRLTWDELEAEMENNLTGFLTVFQQEDADPTKLLIDKLWVNGGVDPRTHEEFPGCWDHDRGEWQLPADLVPPVIPVISADPSPSNFWAVQAWAMVPAAEERILLTTLRKTMGANNFLDRDRAGTYEGLLEEWRRRYVEVGLPLRHIIFEKNAAQRWVYKYRFFQDWLRLHGITVIPHETQRNKADEKLGIEATLRRVWKYGRVRLPGAGTGRRASLYLVEEVIKYPMGRYDDQVMAQWFPEYHWHALTVRNVARDARQERPSWMQEAG